VPALMLECQLSGLFRHCSDVPGDIALGQRENLEAAALQLSPETITELDAIADGPRR
jgi:hypothetical protein